MSEPRRIGLICGVDEAGRGPLCGAVVAAAVILDPARPIEGLADSKKLSERARERLAPLIRERALAWAVAEASVEEIDRLNILHATMLAMKRAVEALAVRPDEALIDGNRCPALEIPARAIVKGDSLEPAISAASILAKTVRDEQMRALDLAFPHYGLAGHKGYPTASHLAAIRRYGVQDFYRRSFGPVRAILENPPLWTEDEAT
ncbi:MAG: ribonuclease HII [Azoarcus sp.]|uniref:Ribonuclease HII n=1 Tax=Parazoarcus communis TaxID=41977 RepID=A0A2U8GLX3_9RHOO|nr:ribonuclease HII [Parazoarcus communis]AWI74599.1 ribonuclease HII [Parazoarcus communis]PLX66283.1 MAG: ribonuclease HII [Azoarcus sp.]TVT53119.1 MAG: ribonuclease HII [Azoarcus sp. PHD]